MSGDLRMNLLHGTIICALRGTDFAVLGSDRLGRKVLEDSDPFPSVRKMAVHPYLPIAVAATGTGGVEIQYSGQPKTVMSATDILDNLISCISSQHYMTEQSLIEMSGERFGPFLRWEREAHRHMGRMEEITGVRLYFALFMDSPHVIELKLSNQIELISHSRLAFSSPVSLHPYYIGKLTGIPIDPPPIWTTEKEAALRQAHGWIQGGIDAERALNGGINLDCGGPIDLVIVDRDGAHRVRLES